MKKPTQVLVGVMAAVMFIAAIPAKCADVPCDSHAWDGGVIVWNEDFSEAVGVWTCSSCGETETAGAEIFLRREEATCEEEGSVRMSANAVMDSYSCFDSRTVELEPLGHRYSEPQFDWDTDDFDCRASYVCTRDDCDETWFVDCDVTETVYPSKGHAPGGVIYTAYVNIGGTDFADTYQVEGNPIEHEYSTPIFCWSEDCRTAYIESVCSVCESEDPDKTLRADCTVRTYVENADCSSDGYAEYTAMAELLGRTWEEKKTVIIPKLEHAYTDPTFAWDDFGCQASYECTAGGETFDEACIVSEQITYTDCTSPGIVTKTAKITIGGVTYSDSVQKEIAAKNHNPVRIPGKGVACTEQGLTDGIACADCKAILLEQTEIPALGHTEAAIEGKAPTCTEEGVSDEKYCTVCNEVLQKPMVIPATGHTAKAVPGYEPTCTEEGRGDGEVCTVCNAVLIEQIVFPALGHTPIKLDARNATCTEDGYTEGEICDVCHAILVKQTIIAATGKHTPQKLESREATCTEEGFSAKMICSVCKMTLAESDVIAPTGHRFGSVVFSWNSDGRSVAAEKTCEVCKTSEQGVISIKEEIVKDNGIDYRLVTVTAQFSDGSEETDKNRIEIPDGSDTPAEKDDPTESPEASEPDMPDAPTDPSVTPTPDVPTPIIPVDPQTPVQPQIPAEPQMPLNDDSKPVIPMFDDVLSDSYYYDAVTWEAQQGITQGTADRVFSPDMVCSRAQIVTMLWRSVDCPVIGGTTDFADVPMTAYYYKAVLWAAKTGITSGTSKTTFSPDIQCTRAQIVTMLWRAAGCPVIKAVTSFSDVANDAWYADAVAWAVQQGITLGTGEGVFSPDAVCTRAQIVTFLYRARDLW